MEKKESETIIELKNLTKKFGNFAAVKNFSLQIRRGEILGILGPNGAGKSTLMKMIANLLKPTEGEVWIKRNGKFFPLKESNKDVLLDNLGFLIENPAFYKNSSPRQLLTHFAKLKGYPRKKIKERVENVVKMIGLTQWIDKKLGTFSKGMRQKIGIASAIVHDPDVIFLDEPQTGLDPKARREVRSLLLKLKEMNKTIFLSSHLLYEISEISDRVAIISNGLLVVCDTLDNLEEEAKQSVIDLELLDIRKRNILDTKSELQHSIGDLIDGKIKFNDDSNIFEISFDGAEKTQYQILTKLMESGFKVIESSVPKTGLLENLYLKYISKSEKTLIEYTKKTVKVESVF